MITNITLAEIQKYYPLSNSVTQEKINVLTNQVRNVIFLQMFGLKNTNDIFNEVVPNSENDTFIGFRNFIAMNIVRQQLEEVHTHTTAGLKAINQPNWSSPTMKEKSYTIIQLSDVITLQQIEASKILNVKKSNYLPYSSIKIHKI